MSQTATETVQAHVANLNLNSDSAPRLDLKEYPRIELTPAIGIRFSDGLSLSKILKRPQEEKDAFFKALAYEIALNGVAVFPAQSDLTAVELEEVAELLHKYSGAPSDGGFHIHPAQRNFDTTKKGGNVLSIGGPAESRRVPASEIPITQQKNSGTLWHSDITFENRPATYSLFQVHTLPRTGGDTLFMSNYAIYDKITPALQTFLEDLTATHSGAHFHNSAKHFGYELFEGPRGAPENVGLHLTASHPIVRTNPLTNLKALFVNPQFTKYIDQLSNDESDAILKHLFKLQVTSNDAIVRHRWDKDDLAIWDNRSTCHTATLDVPFVTRIANRSTTVGEVPYLDKNSLTKSQYDELHPRRFDLPDIQI